MLNCRTFLYQTLKNNRSFSLSRIFNEFQDIENERVFYEKVKEDYPYSYNIEL